MFGLASLLVFTLNAQYSLSGKISDAETASPVADAIILLHETNAFTTSDAEGRFEFGSLNEGNYHLHISRIGYSAATVDVILNANRQLEISLRPAFHELGQVVVEDSYLKSDARDRSLSVAQMSKDQLMSQSAGNLSEGLASLPGIRAISMGSGVAKPVIRGLSGNRILVNDQGVKQEGQQWGNDHGLEIDPFAAERIELIKGPASLLYGSDGLGGVINILPPAIPTPYTWSVDNALVLRENDRSLGATVKAEARSDHLFGSLRGSIRDYGDLRVPDTSFTYLTRVLPIENGMLQNTAGKDRAWTAGIGWADDWGFVRMSLSEFDQVAGLFPGIFGIPDRNSVADDGNDRNVAFPRQEVNHRKLLLNGNVIAPKGWIEFDLGWQRNLRQELAFPHAHGAEVLPESNLALQLNLETWSAALRRHWSQNERWKWVAGGNTSYSVNRYGGWEFLIPAYRMAQAGAFLNSEFKRSGQMTWNFGLRADLGWLHSDRYSERVIDADLVMTEFVRSPEIEKRFLNASGGMGFSWNPGDRFNLKFNAGKSFRIPNAAELASNGVHHGTFRHEMGDPDLEAEHGWQLDLALRYQTRTVMMQLTPYFNYFRGFIYLRPSASFSFLPEAGQIYRYTQHNALFSGAEYLIDVHPVERLHVELSGDAVYSYNTETTLPLPFTPPLGNRLTLRWESDASSSKEWHIGFTVNQFFAQNRVDRNEEPTPDFQTADVFASLSLEMNRSSLKVFFRINNVWNVSYLDHLSRYRQLNLPAQGRNTSLSVQFPISGKIQKNKNN